VSRYYIGLANTFHDPAVAIVGPDGTVLYAEATERLVQSKHAFGVPPDHPLHIAHLLEQYCDPTAAMVVATSWSPWQRLRLGVLALYGSFRAERGIAKPISPGHGLYQEFVSFGARQLGADLAAGLELINTLRNRYGNAQITMRRYPHHLTHAALASYVSPLPAGLCVVADGYGEGGATSAYRYRHGRLDLLAKPASRDSLGFYYGVLTRLCGFDPLHGEEWKVMGLAPYGRLDEQIYHLLRPLIGVERGQIRMANTRRAGEAMGAIHRRYPAGGVPLDYADLAYTGQRIFEETLSAYLAHWREASGEQHLLLTGGCALNSTFNGKICEELGFETLHIPCAPADDGNALGAALHAWRQDHPEAPSPHPVGEPLSPFLGTGVDARAVERLVRHGAFARVTRNAEGAVERAATLLAEGRILGILQGRAEFGPRALGNRSIVADPRDVRMRDHINREVKRREGFRPFAPAVLAEAVGEYFGAGVDAPYMERALKVRPSVAPRIPAVVHVDGTARLQTVRRDWSPHFHALIEAFARKTGVPVLLNTSFNVMGKPIIHGVEDAAAVLGTSGLDALWVGEVLVEKWAAGGRNARR
jgi:carbamoyltransferase